MEVIETMRLADPEVLKTAKTHVWRSKATAGEENSKISGSESS
jgi:hypothetical protein